MLFHISFREYREFHDMTSFIIQTKIIAQVFLQSRNYNEFYRINASFVQSRLSFWIKFALFQRFVD